MSRFRVILAVFALVALVALVGSGSVFAQCQGGAGAQTGLAAVSCSGVAAWNPTGTYAVNAQVTYNNCLYKTNQAFTSNSSWCPGCAGVYLYGNGSACPTAGCLYGAQGPCSGATATATARATATATARGTATPTSTSRATATPTARATATATSSGGSCFPTVWNSGSIYTAGPPPAQVQRVCGSATENFTAAFWTQGDDPCTHRNIGGNGQPWYPNGVCSGGSTPTATPTTNPRATATPTSSGSGAGSIVSSSQFNSMMPSASIGGYTYNGWVTGANRAAGFCTSGDLAAQRRECAAFFANAALETGSGQFLQEINKQGPPGAVCYCQPGAGGTCDPSNSGGSCTAPTSNWYFGRGWLQISWNFNYASAGTFMGINLLGNADALNDPANTTTASLWYWMTQNGGSSGSAHAGIINDQSFGETISAINGGLECPSRGGSNTASRDSRINFYNTFIGTLGTTAGTGNISC